MNDHERMNYWWRRAKAAEAELPKIKAEAWDEGWQAAYYDVWCTENEIHNEGLNPYQEDQK